MTRPALSASRTADVLDLLSASPGRAFSMAEIAREAKINVASCYAILKALSGAGYLTKLPKEKRYILGPALLVAGQAAIRSHPLIERAQIAVSELYDELGHPVMLVTTVGDDILALSSIADRSGRTAGVKAGHRRPIVHYTSMVLVAWSSRAEIDAWIAAAGVTDAALQEEWHRTMKLIRERGYQVTLNESEDGPLHQMMAEMATGYWTPKFDEPSRGLISSTGQRLAQPETLEAKQEYDVSMIAAPLFDQEEGAPLCIALGGFSGKLAGAEIERLAEHLMRKCLQVMRSIRTA